MTTAPAAHIGGRRAGGLARRSSAPVRRADAVPRSAAPAWSSVAAWGAGLIAIAVGAGSLAASPIWAIGLLAIGAGALAWGTVSLVRGAVVVPRIGVAGALAGVVFAGGALFGDPGRTSAIAVAAASVLFVACALACARQMRRPMDAAAPRVAVLLVAAVIVGGIVTPALGATEAGRLAPDHGAHGFVDPGHH